MSHLPPVIHGYPEAMPSSMHPLRDLIGPQAFDNVYWARFHDLAQTIGITDVFATTYRQFLAPGRNELVFIILLFYGAHAYMCHLDVHFYRGTPLAPVVIFPLAVIFFVLACWSLLFYFLALCDTGLWCWTQPVHIVYLELTSVLREVAALIVCYIALTIYALKGGIPFDDIVPSGLVDASRTRDGKAPLTVADTKTAEMC